MGGRKLNKVENQQQNRVDCPGEGVWLVSGTGEGARNLESWRLRQKDIH